MKNQTVMSERLLKIHDCLLGLFNLMKDTTGLLHKLCEKEVLLMKLHDINEKEKKIVQLNASL